ncbi:MAG: GatB/YqeY domain-containing protein [Candidatus Cloacimonetes bacterium]|nr:GatB/YqeY domain-containing protein [Candidatus Cloacimonadota bacterium]
MIDVISQAIKDAMRAKDKERLTVLRSLKSALMNRKIELNKELDKTQSLEVLRKAVKSRQQSIEMYREGDRDDLAEREIKEISIVEEFLPKMLSEDEIGAIVNRVIAEVQAESMKDMGSVIKQVMAETAGQADGRTVSLIVKQKLT